MWVISFGGELVRGKAALARTNWEPAAFAKKPRKHGNVYQGESLGKEYRRPRRWFVATKGAPRR